jgi:hypothetical protein
MLSWKRSSKSKSNNAENEDPNYKENVGIASSYDPKSPSPMTSPPVPKINTFSYPFPSDNLSSRTLRQSIKPVGFVIPPTVMGPSQSSKDPQFSTISDLEGRDVVDPDSLVDKLNRLTDLIQEVNNNDREEHVIFVQMLQLLEERMNKRLDRVVEETNDLFDRKFESLQSELNSIPSIPSARQSRGMRMPRPGRVHSGSDSGSVDSRSSSVSSISSGHSRASH